MKISPVLPPGAMVPSVNTGAEAPQTMAAKIRTLKMNTNATPGRVEEPIPEEVPAAELAIPDNNIDPATTVVEDTQPMSPQFAALAKQRRALQVKEREIAERERALEEQSATQAGGISLDKLKSDPLGVLLEAGVTFEQLTDAVTSHISSGSGSEIRALKEELRAIKEGVDKTLSERDARAEQQALAEMRREAEAIIAQGDEFELVRETGSIPQVMTLIERVYREAGEVLDVNEALTLVENELYKDSLKLAALKKVQSGLAPAQPAPSPQQPQRQMKTLTNRDTASVPLSRKARALAAFQGTLKK